MVTVTDDNKVIFAVSGILDDRLGGMTACGFTGYRLA
jgi:hypothetical protein